MRWQKIVPRASEYLLTRCEWFLRWEEIRLKGIFPVMAKITGILAANICRQFFFVINIAASTRCLVEKIQLICYSQRINATSQYNDSGSSSCTKWPNVWIVAMVKNCELLVQGRRGCRERWLKADFLSWQKSLAYSLRIFVDNFSLLSPLQQVLAAWFKIFNQFAIRSK